jgi:hypothetical protein
VKKDDDFRLFPDEEPLPEEPVFPTWPVRAADPLTEPGRRTPRAEDRGGPDHGPADGRPRDDGPREPGPRQAGPRDDGPREPGPREAGPRHDRHGDGRRPDERRPDRRRVSGPQTAGQPREPLWPGRPISGLPRAGYGAAERPTAAQPAAEPTPGERPAAEPSTAERRAVGMRNHRRAGPSRAGERSSLTDTGSFVPRQRGGAADATGEWSRAGGSDRRSPSWLAAVSAGGAAQVRPGPRAAAACALAAGTGWLAAIVLGFVELRPLWVALALVAGLAALAAGVRGFPLAGLLPVVLGVVAWGFATGDQVPGAATDVPGDLRLLGWALAYAAPLLVAYVSAVTVDARNAGIARVGAATARGRWWGGDLGGERPALLRELEAIPSAQFVVVPDDSLPYLVVAGRRVALVQSTVWPRGRYALAADGEVLRDGRTYAQGGEDVAEMAADVRAWAERLDGAECRGFVVLQEIGGPDDLAVAGGHDTVRVVRSDGFAEVVGGYLSADAHRIDVGVMERLDESLSLFAPKPAAAPAASS